jgi:hypothetical protein
MVLIRSRSPELASSYDIRIKPGDNLSLDLLYKTGAGEPIAVDGMAAFLMVGETKPHTGEINGNRITFDIRLDKSFVSQTNYRVFIRDLESGRVEELMAGNIVVESNVN